MHKQGIYKAGNHYCKNNVYKNLKFLDTSVDKI